MKRAASPACLLDRNTPWLSWWQELILNWVASWDAVGMLHVTSSQSDDDTTWAIPTDIELARLQLEELIQ